MSLLYHIPWTNNSIINITDISVMDLWSNNCKIEIIDKEKRKINEYMLDECRGYLGVYPILDKNILVICYINYVDNESCVLVDFYKIDNKIEKIKQYKIKSNYSCGNTLGKLCKFENDIFYIIFGDLTNNNFFSCVKFNLDNYDNTLTVPYKESYEPEFEQIYLIDPEYILYSNVICYNNILEIRLFNLELSNCFSISTIDIHNINDSEYDSMVYDLFNWSNKLCCLLRIKLYNRIDILHIKSYFLDVIVHINGSSSSVIEMAEPIYYDNNYSGYFGIRPYWIIDNDKLKIFNKNKYSDT